ncbi:MAG: carbohydrate ABC transporter permease [Actinomycetota bacterium]|nr:carbohydrate ABC transporter permease [Actinomycetota bacterium]
MNKKNSSRRWGGQIVLYGLLVLALLWTLVPIIWMVLSSFKSPDDLLSTTPKVIFEPTFQHYQGLFTGANSLWGYIQHSLLSAGISTMIAVALACLAGYGLARSHFRGKHHLSFWIISTRMAPIAAVIVPLYLIFRNLNLLDSVIGLIIAYLTFNLPFAIWLMNAFFADLPVSLEEAAMVDGATRFQAFWRVALPLVTPGIVTTTILCLIFSWNDYAFARTFSGPESQTIPIAASQLITQQGVDWGKLTAIGTVVVLPMVAVGLAVRRYLVRGLTLGAVKGE